VSSEDILVITAVVLPDLRLEMDVVFRSQIVTTLSTLFAPFSTNLNLYSN